MKKAQEELQVKTAKDITKLNMETDCLVVEKADIFYSKVKLEAAVADACQYSLEITTELDAVARS